MSKGAINFAKDNEYYTPKELVDKFGRFDYDPATTHEKAAEFGLLDYDTEESNGLERDWSDFRRIWINPPFTIKHEFLKKAQETYDQSKAEIYFLCPIGFLTTKQFHNLCKGAHIYLPNGRIKFQSGLGKPSKSPAFGSVIIKLADDWSLETMEI